jgi:hypothetical protein
MSLACPVLRVCLFLTPRLVDHRPTGLRLYVTCGTSMQLVRALSVILQVGGAQLQEIQKLWFELAPSGTVVNQCRM